MLPRSDKVMIQEWMKDSLALGQPRLAENQSKACPTKLGTMYRNGDKYITHR